MKKERNCGANVTYQPYQSLNPVYPTYGTMQGGFPAAIPGIMPGIPNTMPMPTMPTFNYPMATSSSISDYSIFFAPCTVLSGKTPVITAFVKQCPSGLPN